MTAGAAGRQLPALVVLAGAILSEVGATLALRAAVDHAGWYLLVVLGYPAAFALLAVVLRRGMSIGAAYGIWSACGVVITALASAVLFDDALTPLMGLGFAVIVAGVWLVENGSHPADPDAQRRPAR